MELWIRSQDKLALVKIDKLEYFENNSILGTSSSLYRYNLGQYKTKERALEVLDEIQDKFKNKYLAKVNSIVNFNDYNKMIKAYEEFNGIDLIGSNELVDITPINQEVLVYEMPQE